MVNWQNYYTHKGYTYGECATRSDHDYYYINIPKNSSSWAGTLLAHWCVWTRTNYHTHDLSHKTALILLRDPVDRWISGIGEYVSLYHKRFDVELCNDQMIDWIFDRVAFDDHTERQSLFIDGIDQDRAVFFWCDQNLSANFTKFLYQSNLINDTFVMPQRENVGDQIPLRSQVQNYFHTLVQQRPKLEQKLKSYYAQDYDLIAHLKFFS